MRIYKELESVGFFKWYCAQYGASSYTAYKEVYDQLPIDNIKLTELNACAFRFLNEKYGYDVSITKCGVSKFQYVIDLKFIQDLDYHFIDFPFSSKNSAEHLCLQKLIQLVKRLH